jgi:hypothetical protein
MNSKHVVFSKRWDGIGGRLNAIVNAMSIAKALGQEFKFAWPKVNEAYLNDPTAVFHPDFLADHQVGDGVIEKDYQHCPLTPESMPLEAALHKINSANVNVYIDSHQNYRVVRFENEARDVAYRRFKFCFDSIKWNTKVEELKSVFAKWGESKQYSALHIRAGDIATGEWKNFIAYEKYTPTPYVHATLKKLVEGCEDCIFVVSDNDRLQSELKGQFGERLLIPKDVYTHYDDLSFLHTALADIFLLSKAQNLYSSPFSAFSRIAANISGRKLHNINKLAQHPKGRELLFGGIAYSLKSHNKTSFYQPLIARDICWAFDVFGKDNSRRKNIAWAKKALNLEPTLPAALCRLARAEATSGNFERALSLSSQSVLISREIQIHKDPLVESICTHLTVFALVLTRAILSKAPLDDLQSKLMIFKTLVTECESNKPYQMDFPGIRHNLHFQLAGLEYLVGQCSKLEKTAVSPKILLHVPMSHYQFAPLENLANEHKFDPVLRFMETTSVKLSLLLGQYIKEYGERITDSSAETIIKATYNQSKTGLQWILGKVSNLMDNEVALFFAPERGAYYASPLFIPHNESLSEEEEPGSIEQRFFIPTVIDINKSLEPEIQLFAEPSIASCTQDSQLSRLFKKYYLFNTYYRKIS